jgi:DNA-binding Lrp family transcriptional regulator
MRRISKKKKVPKYHKIYKHLYDDPCIPLYKIAKTTHISRSTVSRYLAEMYELSILQGPMIFVKPAENYHHYAAFLKFDHPLSAYKQFEGFPKVISRSLCSGKWNLMLICQQPMDFSELKGFQDCLVQNIKGVTHFSKVESLDWKHSLTKMHSLIHPPATPTTLYSEIKENSWGEKEWQLFHQFKFDSRKQVMPVLKECKVRYKQYRKWSATLPELTLIQTAFYPEELYNYFIFDFLFCSQYHTQLTDILGLLPCTSIFFSVGDYVMIRLFLLSKSQKDDLFSLILKLGEVGYFTDYYQSVVVYSSVREFNP